MWYSLFVVYALTDNVFTRERVFMIKSNIYKFLTVICLFSLPYNILASDSPTGEKLSASWASGVSGTDADVTGESVYDLDVDDDGEGSGMHSTTSSGSPMSTQMNVNISSTDSSDSDSDYTFLEPLDAFVEKHPHIVAMAALLGTSVVLYKTNKSFRTKCDAVYARVQTAWKKQKEKPVTHGFLLKSATALSLLYSAKKLGLAPVIPSTFKYLMRYANRMIHSRKCKWAAGLTASAIGAHVVYTSFTTKK
jgi:hypothetical protein